MLALGTDAFSSPAFRFVGLLSLALGFIFLVHDGTKSVGQAEAVEENDG